MSVEVWNKTTWHPHPTILGGHVVLRVSFITPIYNRVTGNLLRTRILNKYFLFEHVLDDYGMEIRWVRNPGIMGLRQHFFYVDHEVTELDKNGRHKRINVTARANGGGPYDVLWR